MAQKILQWTNNCPVKICSDGIVGQRVRVVGGGNYNTDQVDISVWLQGIKRDGDGVIIENDVLLGRNASIIGEITVGFGSVLAALSFVTKCYSILGGKRCIRENV